MKVNWNNATSAKQIVFKFIQELKPQIIFLIYTRNSVIVDKVIITIRHIEREVKIVNENKQVYTLENRIT